MASVDFKKLEYAEHELFDNLKMDVAVWWVPESVVKNIKKIKKSIIYDNRNRIERGYY